MEEGRGSEYGFVGGSGGQGFLVAGFSNGARIGHAVVGAEPFLSSAPSMVVADGSGSWARYIQSANFAPLLYYGGISKTCFRLDDNQSTEVPYFFVSEFSPSEECPNVGVTIFAEEKEAGPAVQSLLSAVPAGRAASNVVWLFPCFTRGVNQSGGRTSSRPKSSKLFRELACTGCLHTTSSARLCSWASLLALRQQLDRRSRARSIA